MISYIKILLIIKNNKRLQTKYKDKRDNDRSPSTNCQQLQLKIKAIILNKITLRLQKIKLKSMYPSIYIIIDKCKEWREIIQSGDWSKIAILILSNNYFDIILAHN